MGLSFGESHQSKLPKPRKKLRIICQVAWLTPSEIFSPHYGQALARHVMQEYEARGSGKPLQVFELGGGTGTLALDFLDSIKQVCINYLILQVVCTIHL